MKRKDMEVKNSTGYCTCRNYPGVYPESDEHGYWVTCQHCRKMIEDSYEKYDFYQNSDINGWAFN